jgi:hypothetical protein
MQIENKENNESFSKVQDLKRNWKSEFFKRSHYLHPAFYSHIKL